MADRVRKVNYCYLTVPKDYARASRALGAR